MIPSIVQVIDDKSEVFGQVFFSVAVSQGGMIVLKYYLDDEPEEALELRSDQIAVVGTSRIPVFA